MFPAWGNVVMWTRESQMLGYSTYIILYINVKLQLDMLKSSLSSRGENYIKWLQTLGALLVKWSREHLIKI